MTLVLGATFYTGTLSSLPIVSLTLQTQASASMIWQNTEGVQPDRNGIFNPQLCSLYHEVGPFKTTKFYSIIIQKSMTLHCYDKNVQ